MYCPTAVIPPSQQKSEWQVYRGNDLVANLSGTYSSATLTISTNNDIIQNDDEVRLGDLSIGRINSVSDKTITLRSPIAIGDEVRFVLPADTVETPELQHATCKLSVIAWLSIFHAVPIPKADRDGYIVTCQSVQSETAPSTAAESFTIGTLQWKICST